MGAVTLAVAGSRPTSAMTRVGRQGGVGRLVDGRVAFHPVKVGVTTLDGRSQILEGLQAGDEVVVHGEQALQPGTSVKVVPAIVPARP